MANEAPPPSYEAAIASGSRPKKTARNGIPPSHRRSMEDEHRPLPKGWVRSFDTEHSHQFFVDTTKDPPQSIWHHPYDDQGYLESLNPSERERIQAMHKTPNRKDFEAESTDEDEDHHDAGSSSQAGSAKGKEKPSLGRKWKDKLTQSTHEERVAARRQREEEERRAYEAHMAFRQAMQKAMMTGQPQFVMRGQDGKDVYIEPPGGARPPPGSRGVNPYTQGPYADPNARFLRSPQPMYGRPYGGGYGGGYGLPLAGGLMGGMLLGGMMGGF